MAVGHTHAHPMKCFMPKMCPHGTWGLSRDEICLWFKPRSVTLSLLSPKIFCTFLKFFPCRGVLPTLTVRVSESSKRTSFLKKQSSSFYCSTFPPEGGGCGSWEERSEMSRARSPRSRGVGDARVKWLRLRTPTGKEPSQPLGLLEPS